VTRDSRARTPQPSSSILPPPVHLERPRLRALPHPPHRPSNKLRIREPLGECRRTGPPLGVPLLQDRSPRCIAVLRHTYTAPCLSSPPMVASCDKPRMPSPASPKRRGVPGCLPSMFRDLGIGWPDRRLCRCFSVADRRWLPGCRAGWSSFHGHWCLLYRRRDGAGWSAVCQSP